jgi:hypothetical protein
MTIDTTPPDRHLLSRWTPWILALVIGGVGVGAFTVWRASGRDRQPAKLDSAFVYDVERYRIVPEEKIGYREVARYETGLRTATALAVGPDGRIAAAGDEKILVFSAEGNPVATIPAAGTVRALAVSPAGELFAASENRVGRCEFEAPITWLAKVPGSKARITSIAVDRRAIYVADAGARAVWRFGLDGKRLGRIGDRDPRRNIPGFNVPSPYFDLLVAPDGLLRIVDPGRHRITAFTARGDLEFAWGKPTFELKGFSGCCNPSHLAMLPDGRFVTSEKGIPRVKVHDADGEFVTAVVGSSGLDTETEPCDVASGPGGRIVLLDPGSRVIRVFEPKQEGSREDR